MSASSDEDQRKDLERLKTLYSISKKLSVFNRVDESFSEILQCASECFPLSSAVLIEHWETEPRTAIWTAEKISSEEIENALKNAKNVYSFFAGSSVERTTQFLNSISPENKLQHNDKALIISKTDSGNYITVPLIIDYLPPLGALQLEGNASLNEKDLDFVIALANLVSVALDRYYKTKREKENQESEARESLKTLYHSQDKVQNLETERDLRESFVSLLTHDLRTPLSIVLGSAQMILRRPDDLVATEKSARLIVTQVHRAGQMVTDLLDANRIRSGDGLQIYKEKVDITELIEHTLSELTVIHGNRFAFTGAPKIECSVDPKSVRRIVENLCNNAVKYGSPTEPVKIQLEETSEAVRISVSNEGSYISPEDQKSLFKQFSRTGSEENKKKKGWGIGLTLVRGVAEAHGGNVSVISEPKTGTTFIVTLKK
jgi:signal transduction histidine kinase